MALYWVLGAAWVAAGDALLAYCVTEPQQLAYWQTLKEILQNLPICLVAVSHRWHPQHL